MITLLVPIRSPNMDQAVAHAIQDFNQAAEQLVRVFKNTPEDRIAWSPSATARTPIQLVAHSAFSIGFIGEMLLGTPYPAKTMAEADAEFLEMEKSISTSEAALKLLQTRYIPAGVTYGKPIRGISGCSVRPRFRADATCDYVSDWSYARSHQSARVSADDIWR